MKNVIITGSTGMVGKGVLLECIDSPEIGTITLINRSPIDIKSEKIKEIILKDFMEMESIASQLDNIDACFHCMGVSSVGLNEEEFSKLTFDITQKLADVCYAHNPNMTFIYVSGTGTDSTEKGRTMWARVKGKTENYILNLGFGKAYMFRPGIIIPEKGIKSRTKLYARAYAVMRPLFPLFKRMSGVTTTTKIGHAMINAAVKDKFDYSHPENKEINMIATVI